MPWLDMLGTGVGTVLGLLVGALIAAAGFNMATNRSGKADQLAADYQETLDRDKRRGLGWLGALEPVPTPEVIRRLGG